jgi:hypothetical protein
MTLLKLLIWLLSSFKVTAQSPAPGVPESFGFSHPRLRRDRPALRAGSKARKSFFLHQLNENGDLKYQEN